MRFILLMAFIGVCFAAEDHAVTTVSVGECAINDDGGQKALEKWMLGIEGTNLVAATITKVGPKDWEKGFDLASNQLGALVAAQGFNPERFNAAIKAVRNDSRGLAIIPVTTLYDRVRGYWVIKCAWSQIDDSSFGHTRSWTIDVRGGIAGFITCR